MEVEIVSKKENVLLDRTEVKFKVVHPKEGTPKREDVRDKLSSAVKAPKERVIVDSMDSEFGRTVTVGYAKIYKTKESAIKFEREQILVRNKLKEKKAKAEKKPAAAPPAARPAAGVTAKAPEKPQEKAPEKHADKPAEKEKKA